MLLDFLEGQSFGWVCQQNSTNQILSLLRHTHIRYLILVVTYVFVGFLDSIALEWWLAEEKCVENDTHRPNVRFVRVSFFF